MTKLKQLEEDLNVEKKVVQFLMVALHMQPYQVQRIREEVLGELRGCFNG